MCRFAAAREGAESAAADPALGQIALERRESPPIRPDLLALFERDELAKYLTDEELTP